MIPLLWASNFLSVILLRDSQQPNTSTFSEINGTWDSSLKGWNFFTDASRSKTIFFPASGYRVCSTGGAANVGSYGSCWSAVPHNQYYGRNLAFNSSNVYPLSNSDRAYGFGVRSSQEFVLVRGRESFECKLQKWLNVIRDRICLRIFFMPITRRGRRKEKYCEPACV